MSKPESAESIPTERRKRKLAEMATGDSDATAVYRLKFVREYGCQPEEVL